MYGNNIYNNPLFSDTISVNQPQPAVNMVGGSSSVNPSKTILVIDWSNLMFRSLFLHKLYYGSTSGYEREEDIKSFTNRFAVDVCSIINTIKPAHTIICTDSQSAWRKTLLPGENGYKGNREKDPSVNWDNVYKCSDDLLNILSRQGMDVASVLHAEADDIIACVKEVVFESFPNYNIIIVSADADIRQLIEFNQDTKQFCIVYNTTSKPNTKKKHMYVPQSFKNWIEAPVVCDIFFSGYTMENSKNSINDILRANANIEVTVDDADSILLKKILCGDDGDNVPSFYSFYKNDRLVRMTPKRAEKLMTTLNVKNISDLCNSVDKISETMGTIFKRPINDVDCRERLERQRLLVELSSPLFPKEIREYKESIKYMLENIKFKPYVQLHSNELLKNTEYEDKGKKSALEAEVLKEFKKRSKGFSSNKNKQESPKPTTPASGFSIDVGLF